jgi:hypothetical protein
MMAMLIGFITGVWIIATIWSSVVTMQQVVKSDLHGNVKFNLGLMVFLANLLIIETIIEISLLLVDKL